jgi:hypothetical protein
MTYWLKTGKRSMLSPQEIWSGNKTFVVSTRMPVEGANRDRLLLMYRIDRRKILPSKKSKSVTKKKIDRNLSKNIF